MLTKARLLLLLLTLSMGTSQFYQAATPMPLEMAINEATQQCAKVILGDECMTCTLPEGWEILGYYLDTTCPDGYDLIDLDLDCVEKENCQWNIGQGEEVSNTPNLTLIGSIFGLVCCGLVVVVVVTVLIIWMLSRRKKK